MMNFSASLRQSSLRRFSMPGKISRLSEIFVSIVTDQRFRYGRILPTAKKIRRKISFDRKTPPGKNPPELVTISLPI